MRCRSRVRRTGGLRSISHAVLWNIKLRVAMPAMLSFSSLVRVLPIMVIEKFVLAQKMPTENPEPKICQNRRSRLSGLGIRGCGMDHERMNADFERQRTNGHVVCLALEYLEYWQYLHCPTAHSSSVQPFQRIWM